MTLSMPARAIHLVHDKITAALAAVGMSINVKKTQLYCARPPEGLPPEAEAFWRQSGSTEGLVLCGHPLEDEYEHGKENVGRLGGRTYFVPHSRHSDRTNVPMLVLVEWDHA